LLINCFAKTFEVSSSDAFFGGPMHGIPSVNELAIPLNKELELL